MRSFDAASVAPPSGARPFKLPAHFPPDTPVDLEIGCGVGWRPIRYAQENPARVLIAIEHTRAKFEKFESRIARNPPLENLIAVHADAIRWVTHCLTPQSVSRCFILYPNPEPKAPSRRWLRMPFMQRLLSTLAPDGELILATNELAYFKEAKEFAVSTWQMTIARERSFSMTTEDSLRPRTHFEKKYLERGETCHELILIK